MLNNKKASKKRKDVTKQENTLKPMNLTINYRQILEESRKKISDATRETGKQLYYNKTNYPA